MLPRFLKGTDLITHNAFLGSERSGSRQRGKAGVLREPELAWHLASLHGRLLQRLGTDEGYGNGVLPV